MLYFKLMDTIRLKQAISLAKQGNKQEARSILRDLVWLEPENIQAWMWLADTSANPEDRLDILRQGLRQNPDDAMLLRAVNALAPQNTPPSTGYDALPSTGYDTFLQAPSSPISWDEPEQPESPRALDLSTGELKSLSIRVPDDSEKAGDDDWLRSLREFSVDPAPAALESSAEPWQMESAAANTPQLPASTGRGDESSVAAWLAELDSLQADQATAAAAPASPKIDLKKPATENVKSQPVKTPQWMEPLQKNEAATDEPVDVEEYEIHDAAPRRRLQRVLLVLILLAVLAAGGVLAWPTLQGWAAQLMAPPAVTTPDPAALASAEPTATPTPLPTRTFTPTITPSPTPWPTPLPTVTPIPAVVRPDGLSVANIQQFKALASVRARGAVAFDARLLAALLDSQTVRIWDFATEKLRLDLKGPKANIQQVVISPDGKLAAAASEEPAVWVWNVESGAVVATLAFSPDLVSQYTAATFPRTLQVQFSPDSKAVLASSLLGVTWWDLQTQQERHFFPLLAAELKTFREQALVPLGKNATSCLSVFTPDGKILAVGTPFKVYLLSWPSGGGVSSLSTGKPLVEMRWMQNGLLGLFHPGLVSVWDTVLNKQIQSFANLKTQPANLPPNAGFRLDGRVMAVEAESARGLPGGLKLVELPSGKILLTVDPHTDSVVENPQFSLDGRLLFGSSGGDLFIWDTTTGKELRRIANRRGFSGMSVDGKLFVEVSPNDTNLWGVPMVP